MKHSRNSWWFTRNGLRWPPGLTTLWQKSPRRKNQRQQLITWTLIQTSLRIWARRRGRGMNPLKMRRKPKVLKGTIFAHLCLWTSVSCPQTETAQSEGSFPSVRLAQYTSGEQLETQTWRNTVSGIKWMAFVLSPESLGRVIGEISLSFNADLAYGPFHCQHFQSWMWFPFI